MEDKTILKTTRNDTQLQIQVGDRCNVISGQFQGCQGTIESINEQQISTLKTLDKIPIAIKVHAKELVKFFKVGEGVRILQGCHAGEPGQVLEIAEMKHAVVLMESTKTELKVLITNLRRKEEQDFNSKHSLSNFLNQNS